MDKFEYYARLQQFDFTVAQLQIAMELPGFCMSCESVLGFLRLTIVVKQRPKMDTLLRLAKLVALLDAPRNGIFSDDDIESFFKPFFI